MMKNSQIKSAETESLKPRKEILCDGYFYDVTDFIKRHPGGTVIEYYTEAGEDATHAIQQFHYRSITHVKTMMKCLKKRPASDNEIGLNAEVMKKNRALTEDFTKLHLELEKEGIFETSFLHYFWRTMEFFLLVGFGVALIRLQNIVAIIIGILILTLGRSRGALGKHEIGHHQYTGHSNVDRTLHSFLAAICGGLSGSKWRRNHNRHHAMPQRLHHDVDIDTMPLLAFNAKAVKNSKDGKTFMIQNQVYLFLLIDTLLVAIFWNFYQDPKFMLKRRKYLEIIGSVVHWYMFWFMVGFWPWLISTWLVSIILFGNFTLSHTYLPVTTKPTHWVEYSLLHTSDVEHTVWCTWVMGYLNYQIEHHLFPTVPQFKLHLITDRVKALAEKHNIPFIIQSYPEACRRALKNLSNVSKELEDI